MKHSLHKLFLLIGVVLSFTVFSQTDDLMIVEYWDASSGNGTAIKIFNPTPNPINLTGYRIVVSNNGGAINGTTNLTGSIPAGGALTGHGNGSDNYRSSCPITDFTFSTNGVNGNDHIGLQKNGVYVDMINLPHVDVFPRVNGVGNGLVKTHIIRQNTNCTRYTSTNGSSTNSWPLNGGQNLTGWDVYGSSGRCLNTTNYNPTILRDTVLVEICQGDSALINGQYEKNQGFYSAIIPNAAGCGKIRVTNLVYQTLQNRITIDTTVCEGQSIFLQGAFRNLPGTYLDTISSVVGCDSIITTNLKIQSLGGDTSEVVICQGENIVINGIPRSIASVYSDTTKRFGCDSVHFYNLIVNPNYKFNQNFTICDGDSIVIHGRALKSNGTFNDTLISQYGCDSIWVTNLIVNSINVTSTKDTICTGDSILLGGKYRKLAGFYTDSLQSSHSCDSIVNTQLVVLQPVYGSAVETICFGDSIFLGGVYRKTAGFYSDTINSLVTNCDSINLVQLNVTNRQQILIDTTFCQGDSVLVAGKYYAVSTTVTDTLSGSCGLVKIYTVREKPSYQLFKKDTICFGEFIVVGGVNVSTSGQYKDTLISSQSCDSIITTELTVLPSFSSNLSFQICDNDSVLIGGVYRKTNGVYREDLQSVDGCDSVSIITLEVSPSYEFIIDTTICQNSSIQFGGQILNQSGTYYNSLTTSSGCDSIYKLNLNVLNPVFKTSTINVCEGDSVFIQNKWIKKSGIFQDSISSKISNCDSIIESINVIVNPTRIRNVQRSICEGDKIVIGGIPRSIAGTYIDTLQTLSGCDSVLITNLIVYQEKKNSQTLTICEGDTVIISGVERYLSGIYVDTLQSVEGCDSIIQSTLNLTPSPKSIQKIQLCKGDNITIDGVNYTQNDTIYKRFSISGTCDSIAITEIEFIEILAEFNYEQFNKEQFEITFMNTSSNATNFDWYFEVGENSSQKNPIHVFKDSGFYEVQLVVSNTLGCTDTVNKNVYVSFYDVPRLFVPSIFTPNGDGVNDFFEVKYSSSFPFSIVVYNRWGEMLFSADNLDFKWDGTFKGEAIPQGTYYYLIQGQFIEKGSISILR